MDDATLLVNLFAFEAEASAPVAEDEEAGVDIGDVGGGYVVNVVDGLVGRGVGVEVLSELYADAFAILDEAVSGEVFAAVEGHVLKEVCQTALTLFFLYCTDLLCNVEVGLVLGLFVVADVVGEPIVELADLHRGVDGERGHLLCCGGGNHGRGNQKQKEFNLFH